MPTYLTVPGFFDAPAKINLALHVVGQRDDGYHLIDTLVTFAKVGDTLHFEESDALTLTVSGPEAQGVPSDGSNLILKAAHALMEYTGQYGLGMAIHLEKRLPAASGIGGGSSDAASAMDALNAHWKLGLDDDTLSEIGLKLGADIPMCQWAVGLRAQGIGEIITQENLPNRRIVLVNPRVSVPTAAVFKGLTSKTNQPIDDDWKAQPWPDALHSMRNDLEEPALEVAPVIGDCLTALRDDENCLIARMSGSGATCFGLYDAAEKADAAAKRIQLDHPDWWVVSTRTMG